MQKLTSAQSRALSLLLEGPIDAMELQILGLRVATLHRLADAGLAKYRPYGQPPTWAATAAGRKVAQELG